MAYSNIFANILITKPQRAKLLLGRRDPNSNVGYVYVNNDDLALNLNANDGNDNSDYGVSVDEEV